MNSPAAAQPTVPESGQNEKFPPQIAFIVGNEACERFSYYGMSSILNLYLAKTLLTGVDATAHAKEIVHLFNTAIYFMPLVGGWLADRWWGRYRTILYVSLFYCLGHGTLALFGDTLNGVYAGLTFIAIGSGGIKPCVAAFVGDQFGGRQGKWLTRVYGWFYWAVNFGALFGYTVIPALAHSKGYRVAFGVPGVFMGLATLVFWLGTKYYVKVPPGHQQKEPGFLVVLWYAITKWPSSRSFFGPVREHFGEEAVASAKAVLRILVVFSSVPVFWALYWQVNTTWVDQADKMQPFEIPLLPLDLTIFGLHLDFRHFQVNSETMQSAGALLVMIWVPVMTFWLYPLAEKLGLRPTPLRRMGLGMVLAAASFFICAWLQTWLDRGDTVGIAWQIIPYIVLEAGEVLVSATALEFAFAQAPPAMKSTIMSYWFLTSSIGNFMVAIFTGMNANYVHAKGASEFVFYAVLMLAAAAIFMLCTRIYRGRETASPA
jgi:proton-dependent oligopeptide transporter, POT family